MKSTAIGDRGLVRLISETHHKPTSLRGLVDSEDEMAVLAEIEGMTSARLIAERGRNMHLDRRELAWRRRYNDLKVYGATHINAAFAYTREGGNRFNGPERGAWYCSWDSMTAIAEVGYHRTRELGYIGVFHDSARYVELLADFIGDFPDLTDEPDHPALKPDPVSGYAEGQALAAQLRRGGFRGLIYPSVRHCGGRCLVSFDPAAIQNVRPGAKWQMSWDGTPDYSINGV